MSFMTTGTVALDIRNFQNTASTRALTMGGIFDILYETAISPTGIAMSMWTRESTRADVFF